MITYVAFRSYCTPISSSKWGSGSLTSRHLNNCTKTALAPRAYKFQIQQQSRLSTTMAGPRQPASRPLRSHSDLRRSSRENYHSQRPTRLTASGSPSVGAVWLREYRLHCSDASHKHSSVTRGTAPRSVPKRHPGARLCGPSVFH